MTITVVTGGVRSGKSTFAEKLAKQQSESVLYVAFGVIVDQEMEQRIEKHRIRRPEQWGLVEKPYELLNGIKAYKNYDCILIDCLSTWVSNQCIRIQEEQQFMDRRHTATAGILQEIKEWLAKVVKLNRPIIIVTSETGLGGVHMSPLGRFFQDNLGEVNQLVAEAADEVYAVLSGIPVRIKSC